MSQISQTHFPKQGYVITTITHFTLHLLSDWRMSGSSPLAYLHERTREVDIGAFLHCKNSKICFVGSAYGIAKAGEYKQIP